MFTFNGQIMRQFEPQHINQPRPLRQPDSVVLAADAPCQRQLVHSAPDVVLHRGVAGEQGEADHVHDGRHLGRGAWGGGRAKYIL